MADWYVSSTKYATYTAFAASHAYSIGDLIIPTSPASQAKWVFRCTTAGTSSTEPSWTAVNNGTNTSGGATFTNVTGQSTYAWNAAAGDYNTLMRGTNTRAGPGDNIYISSDHSESVVTLTIGLNTGANTGYSLVKVLSVNKAGSTPPVAADLLAGASLAGQVIDANAYAPIYYYGITFNTNAANSWTGQSSSSNSKSMLFDTCTLYMSTASAVEFCTSGSTAFPAPTFAILNSTVQLSGAGQYFGSGGGLQQYDIVNMTLTGTAPTTLIKAENQGVLATVRGSDLSSVTSNLTNTGNSAVGMKVLFEGCKIASGCTRYNTSGIVNTRDEVELVNCYDGTHIISERYQPSGTLTTEFSTYLTAGAQDNVGHYSHKMVSTANCDKWVNTFNSFWMDLNYTTTGSSKTATVEISAASSLNNDDVSLWLEYEGTASSSLSSFANTLPATVLTTASALTSSAAAWTSGAGTNMKLQITFTPQTAGRLRGQIRLGKASTTIYVNPQITVT